MANTAGGPYVRTWHFWGAVTRCRLLRTVYRGWLPCRWPDYQLFLLATEILPTRGIPPADVRVSGTGSPGVPSLPTPAKGSRHAFQRRILTAVVPYVLAPTFPIYATYWVSEASRLYFMTPSMLAIRHHLATR